MLEGFAEKLNEGINYSTDADLQDFRYGQIVYNNDYGKNPYFMSDGNGDAILRVSVNNKGKVVKVDTPIQPAHIAKSNLGLQSDMSGTYKVFHVLAGRGIEHPGTYKQRDEDAVTRKMGKPEYDIRTAVSPEGELVKYKVAKPGSPASDAVIKTYLNYAGVIEDFIKSNMEGYDAYTDADNSGAEIAAAKNSPELAAKVAGKMDMLDKQTNRPKRQAPDIKALQKEKEELVNRLQSLKGNDKSVRGEAKKVRNEIKFLDKKIKELDYTGSSKDDYLKSKNK